MTRTDPRTCVEPLERRALLSVSVAGFAQTPFVTGLVRPSSMTFAPDGRLFISQKQGDLRVVKDGQLLPTPFLSVPAEDSGERGLTGIAFDPHFATNHFVYVYWTAKTPVVHNRVSRFTADPSNPDMALPGSEVDLLDLPELHATNHNGGGLQFGPDGKLYVSVGENGNPPNAQSLSTPLGKMLRINPDGSIPSDNPFVSQTTGINQAIWATGLRNPFTYAFQPGTGRMFINDVGQDTWEEIDEGKAGANYGWPTTEGPTGDPRFTGPIYTYQHATGNARGNAIVGAAFYEPPAGASGAFPASYTGDYFFADYGGNFVKSVDLSGGQPGTVTTFATGLAAPIDVDVGPDGALYVLTIVDNAVAHFAFTGSGAPSIAAPPASQTVSVGRPATFTVNASGRPAVVPVAARRRRDRRGDGRLVHPAFREGVRRRGEVRRGRDQRRRERDERPRHADRDRRPAPRRHDRPAGRRRDVPRGGRHHVLRHGHRPRRRHAPGQRV